MREDMSKVVIERPRWGHRLPSGKTRLRLRRYDPDKEYDDLPKRVSGSRSKHMRAGEIKHFSDLLGPLQRFLSSNVGRPWDDVYSEMKQTFDSRKVTGQHIFDHVKWEVEMHPVIGEDGKIYKSYPHYRERELLQELYVDPRTGLLCRAERNHRKTRKEETGPAVRISIAIRVKTEAEINALREREQAAEAYSTHPALLRLQELETLRELARTASARIYIGFDKHHDQESGAPRNGRGNVA